MPDPVASLVAIAAVLATPGPTNTLLATAGSDGHGRDGWRLLVAELAGYATSVTVLRLVGAPVLAALPTLGMVLRLLLAAYLLRLGFALWRRDLGADGGPAVSVRRLYTATLLNPKGAIFAFALFPENAVGGALLAWAVGFATVVVLCGGLWFLAGDRLRRFGGSGAAHVVPRLAATVLVGFAAVIAGSTLAAVV